MVRRRRPVVRFVTRYSLLVGLACGALGTAQAGTADQQAHGIELMFGGGVGSDPGGSDTTFHLSIAGGARLNSRITVGAEYYRAELTDHDDVLWGVFGKVYPLYNDFVNPYARAGIGFPDVHASGAAGVELGYRWVALYGEVVGRYPFSLHDSESETSLVAGLIGISVHLSR